MNAHEFLYKLQREQPKIFAARKVIFEIASLEELIVAVFEAGERVGEKKANEKKSEFEKLFGKI